MAGRPALPADLAVIFAALLLEAAQDYIIRRVRFEDCPGHPEPCWVWTKGGDGRYGHAYFMGERFKAHRLAYLAFRGPIPRKHVIDHEACDRYDCASPLHTRACTESDNMSRCWEVGRGKSPFIKQKDEDDDI